MKFFNNLSFWFSLSGLIVFFIDFGYQKDEFSQSIFNAFYFVVIFIGIIATIIRYFNKKNSINTKVLAFDIFSISFAIILTILHFRNAFGYSYNSLFYNDTVIKFMVFISFLREFAEVRLKFNRNILNPAQLFVLSFMGIIIFGAFLLMLPNATRNGISFIDALFTSTSAVCVTGLTVVDTANYFTEFGKYIILLLIQLGGLGILTIASYFSYFFKGGSSFENQLTLSDITSSKAIGQVFSTIKYILLITLIVESISGFLVYLSLDSNLFKSQYEMIFFSMFHSVSAFCNAGFSTLSNNLYEKGFQFNYFLHIIIAFTIIFGGLGFPIVVNTLKYIKYKIGSLFFFKKGQKRYKPWVLNLDSRIVIFTTLFLIISGTLLIFFIEYNNTLKDHNLFGKAVSAFFASVTPRTAGFNTIDMTKLAFPTILLTIILMWIGASPASTGGGIKTSTFAIAILNIISLARGKTRIEIFRREISDMSVRRAFATIALSLIVIGFGVLFISIFDPDKGLINIAFECFSAFGTVGLSLGITPNLTSESKTVLVLLMFIGRVSMLSILIAIVKNEKYKNYRFSTEEITIN